MVFIKQNKAIERRADTASDGRSHLTKCHWPFSNPLPLKHQQGWLWLLPSGPDQFLNQVDSKGQIIIVGIDAFEKDRITPLRCLRSHHKPVCGNSRGL